MSGEADFGRRTGSVFHLHHGLLLDSFRPMERHRRLVETSPDGILIVEDGRITFANPAAVRLFGLNDPGQLSSRPLVDLLAVDSREGVLEHLLPRPAERTARPLDAQIVRPDGTVRDISLTGSPMDEGGGR